MSDTPLESSHNAVPRALRYAFALAALVLAAAAAEATVVLSSGYVAPGAGDTTTPFTYRVKYWNTDGVLPGGVKVAIWSQGSGPSWFTMWPLDPADSDPTDGKWYTMKAQLTPVPHAYRFAADTGGSWGYWPQPPGSYAPGPSVAAPEPAVLSSGYVTPTWGRHDTCFTWRVKYWNALNEPPDQVWCAIWWGSRGKAFWYPMWALDPSDANYRDGNWYTLRMRWLDTSAHAYRFAAKQGDRWAYWPQPAGSYRGGPTVGPYAFDGDSIRGPYVVRIAGQYLMAYDARGGRWDTGFSEPSIGIATSADGIHWAKYAHNPVIPEDSRWPCLLHDQGDASAPLKMWYNVPDPFDGASGGLIKYATSLDGFAWTQVGTALGRGATGPLDGTYDDLDIAAPSVVKVSGTYYMYYGAFSTAGPKPICLATSANALDWAKIGPVLDVGPSGAWDSDWVTQVFVLFKDDQFHMWYRGRKDLGGAYLGQIGYAVSDNGVAWTKSPANPVVQSTGDPEVSPYYPMRPSVVDEGSSLKMWFSAEKSVWHALSPAGSPIAWSVHPEPVMTPSPPG